MCQRGQRGVVGPLQIGFNSPLSLGLSQPLHRGTIARKLTGTGSNQARRDPVTTPQHAPVATLRSGTWLQAQSQFIGHELAQADKRLSGGLMGLATPDHVVHVASMGANFGTIVFEQKAVRPIKVGVSKVL